MIAISTFDDLLQAAVQQPEPQRLLFVFTAAELPGGHTPVQKERYESGQGGALSPVMCVDKLPAELPDFASLVQESEQFGKTWDVVFVGALAGSNGQPPAAEDAEKPLQRMIQLIHSGTVGGFVAFNRRGEPLQFA